MPAINWRGLVSDEPLVLKPCGACREKQVATRVGELMAAVDYCIAPLVAALNAGGVATTQSCCGHRQSHGRVLLRDGRELTVHLQRTSSAWDD